MRYLVLSLDAAGNWPPERTLIRALVDRGHEVHVASDAVHESDIVGAGARYVPYSHALGGMISAPNAEQNSQPQESDTSELERIFNAVLLNADFGDELTGAIERIDPDVLLVDMMLWSAISAAEHSGLPTAVLWHTVFAAWGALQQLPPFAVELLNAQRQELGLDAVTGVFSMAERAAATLVFTLNEFDLPSADLPDTLHYVGPLACLPEPLPAYQLPWPADDSRPLVLVSYSTSFQDQVDLLQRVIDALAELPVRGLVTLGPAIEADQLTVPGNVVCETFVPHAAVLPAVDLVVTHAGHGTTMAAVTAGIPLLCTPMGRDQNEVGECVERNGLGQVVSQEASAEELRDAIAGRLADAAMRDRCRGFADAVDLEAGMSTAIDVLEAMRRPLIEP
jgi:MGT family glycosyltransferase